MSRIEERLQQGNALIGMVHVLPLPGTRNYGGDLPALVNKAVEDAKTLERAGFDAYIVEPMCDQPSGMHSSSLRISVMSAVAAAISREVKLPFGISYSSDDPADLIAMAKGTGADFVRVSAFVDAVMFVTGRRVYPCAAAIWEAQHALHAEQIAVLADIHVKHARMLFEEVTLEESATLAQMQGAAAIIVTGNETGEETPINDLNRVAKVAKIPLLSGSGVSQDNVREQLEIARGLIVGSSIKQNGNLRNPVDYEMCRKLVQQVR